MAYELMSFHKAVRERPIKYKEVTQVANQIEGSDKRQCSLHFIHSTLALRVFSRHVNSLTAPRPPTYEEAQTIPCIGTHGKAPRVLEGREMSGQPPDAPSSYCSSSSHHLTEIT